MITRCPACSTLFRVVPDQLRISEGWVRCGKCAEVFDGAACMVDDTVESAAPPARADGTPAAVEPVPEIEAPQPVAPSPVSEEPAPAAIETVAAPTCEPPPEPEAAAPLAPTAGEIDVEALAPVVDTGARIEPVLGDGPSGLAEPVQDVSFLRASRRKAFWRSGGVRVTLSLLALLLVCTLLLQVAWQERDRLAVQWPVLRPALEQMCGHWGCRVGPWRQIDAIAIDSSSFNRVRGDVYRLGLGLRNTMALDLAMPSIELSLTDPLDQTVLRRVLSPEELGQPGATLAAGRDWSATVTLQVSLAPGTPRIAGYRVLAFYP